MTALSFAGDDCPVIDGTEEGYDVYIHVLNSGEENIPTGPEGSDINCTLPLTDSRYSVRCKH